MSDGAGSRTERRIAAMARPRRRTVPRQAVRALSSAIAAPTAMTAPPLRPTLVVAVAHRGVIGRNNALPWRLPEDLKHFKATTTGHTLVMGRRTFESIGRPLPGRRTIVLSRDAGWHAEGTLRAGSLDEALALAAREPFGNVFVVGGAQVYRDSLPLAARAIVTEIDLDVDGDAFFAPLDPREWQAVRREAQVSSTGLRFAIVEYRRCADAAPAAGARPAA